MIENSFMLYKLQPQSDILLFTFWQSVEMFLDYWSVWTGNVHVICVNEIIFLSSFIDTAFNLNVFFTLSYFDFKLGSLNLMIQRGFCPKL